MTPRTTTVPYRDWPWRARLIERLYRLTHGGQIRTLVVRDKSARKLTPPFLALRTDLAKYVNTTDPAPQWIVAEGILTRACRHALDAGDLQPADAAEIIYAAMARVRELAP